MAATASKAVVVENKLHDGELGYGKVSLFGGIQTPWWQEF